MRESLFSFFKVEGTPVLNNHGTPGSLGVFDRLSAPEMDDFLEGETYIPLFAVTGVLPASLHTLDYLEFSFKGKARLKLEPNKGYAFMLMFAEPATENRGLTLLISIGEIILRIQQQICRTRNSQEGLPLFSENFRTDCTFNPPLCLPQYVLFAICIL